MGKSIRPLTLVMAYYDNPTMLARQLVHLNSLPEYLYDNLIYVVVDDGSPRWPASEVDHGITLKFCYKLFRIKVDIPWNQDAARNLAVHNSPSGWILLTDMDHIVPQSTFERVMCGKLHESFVYKFGRVSEPELESYKPHPNSWLMTKDLYDKAGGYDERLAGHYGTDSDFRDRVHAVAFKVEQLPDILIRVPREVTPDASTTTLKRKDPADAAALRLKKAARLPGSPTLRLSFPWKRLK